MSKRKHPSEEHEPDVDPPPEEESRPSRRGTYYGELSLGGQWFWRGTGSPEDEWIANPALALETPAPAAPPEVEPLAASPTFYITVALTYPPGATQIEQASTYQIITPWGQSTPCINILDAFNQMVTSGSNNSGQMWNYLNFGITRGLVTAGGATVPQSASYFQALP